MRAKVRLGCPVGGRVWSGIYPTCSPWLKHSMLDGNDGEVGRAFFILGISWSPRLVIPKQ